MIKRCVKTIQSHDDSGAESLQHEEGEEASIVLDLRRATVIDAAADEALTKMQLKFRQNGTKIDILRKRSGIDNPACEEDQTQL